MHETNSRFDEIKKEYLQFLDRVSDGDADKDGKADKDYSIHEVKYAYITFKTMRAKEAVANAYERNNTAFRRYCACCLKKEAQAELELLKLLGQMPKIDEADTPANIMWENLSVSGKSRFFRQVISWLFAIFLLLISLIGTIIIMSQMT